MNVTDRRQTDRQTMLWRNVWEKAESFAALSVFCRCQQTPSSPFRRVKVEDVAVQDQLMSNAFESKVFAASESVNPNHRCNRRFLRFLFRSRFFPFFNVFFIFHEFYFLEMLSNAKYKYVKIQRKIFLEDDLVGRLPIVYFRTHLRSVKVIL